MNKPSTLLVPGLVLPQKGNDLSKVHPLKVVESFTITLPARLSLAERIASGDFDEVEPNVNDRNFPLDALALAFTKPTQTLVVIASVDSPEGSWFTTEILMQSIGVTGFRSANTAIHLESSKRYHRRLLRDQALFSLGAISPDWRGHDCQKSVLTSVNTKSGSLLSNYLFGENRTWRKESLFMLAWM